MADFQIEPLWPSGCRALRARRPVRASNKRLCNTTFTKLFIYVLKSTGRSRLAVEEFDEGSVELGLHEDESGALENFDTVVEIPDPKNRN